MKKFLQTLLLTLLVITAPLISNAQQNTNSSQTTSTGTTIQTNDEQEKPYEKTLKELLPTQEQLFQNQDNKNQFAEGDLEQDILPKILRLLIIISGTGIAFIFTYVSFKLVISRGDEAELTNLKNTFTQIIIGTILVLSAFAIVVGILQYFDSLR